MSDGRDAADNLSPIKQALLLIEDLQGKLNASERSKNEPVAIIGMGCRFPGAANDQESFWRLLHNGVDTIRQVPKYRWDIERYFDPDPEKAGKVYTRYGSFLDDVDKFDAKFFGISPRETTDTDPQQRILLEVAWEAIENAALAPGNLLNSSTGVFVGVMNDDYAKLLLKSQNPEVIGPYFSSGTHLSFNAGRISYVLGLHGPSIALDTACSSSLVSIHLACQSLRLKESGLALAGGVNLNLSPELGIGMCQVKALSADGRCKTFDASADGFGQGEGCGVVVLKLLSEAIKDGDNILALIHGSSVNHDGASAGLTVPNGIAQEALLRKAIENAGVDPLHISYIETHGTGTSLGDPIEVETISAVLAGNRNADNPLFLGSLKSNIGHTESAAGVAGLIKVVLAMQNEEIPPNMHYNELNPQITIDDNVIKIPTEPVSWPRGKRLASVSSFGLSGTNAHFIIGEAPQKELKTHSLARPLHLLTLSAKEDKALIELAERYERFFIENADTPIASVCHTTNSGRSHFSTRLVISVDSVKQAQERLRDFLSKRKSPGILTGQSPPQKPKIAFLFTGQGSQYFEMGRQLYQTQPTFRKELDRCDELLRPYLKHSLLSVLYDENISPSLINETAYTQPALFAIEYALAKLWISWGIEPDAVLGHSIGEYVAAYFAGVFNLPDGLKLIAERGRLIQSLPKEGMMAAVFTSEKIVEKEVAHYTGLVSIATINGPENIVISGESVAIQKILDRLNELGVKSQKLNVSHAFHSPLMEPILEQFERTAHQTEFHVPNIPLLSNVSGGYFAENEIPDAAYWSKHIRNAVRFSDGLQKLYDGNYRLFLEVGPTPVLMSMGMRFLSDDQITWISSLRKKNDDWQMMLETLSKLYISGTDIDWPGFDKDYSDQLQRIALPTYPFQKKSFWLNQNKSKSIHNNSYEMLHPLLGREILSPLKEKQFEIQLSIDSTEYFTDHEILGNILVPGTAFVEMAVAAANIYYGNSEFSIESINIQEPVILIENELKTIQFIVSPDNNMATFKICSQDGKKWKQHVSGIFESAKSTEDVSPQETITDLRKRIVGEIDVGSLYSKLHDAGFIYGPWFKGLKHIWKSDNEILARIELPGSTDDTFQKYHMHPALLDSAFQLSLAFINEDPENEELSLCVPVGAGKMTFFKSATNQAWAHAVLKSPLSENQESVEISLRLMDQQGQKIAEIDNIYFKITNSSAFQRLIQPDFNDWYYKLSWELDDEPAEAAAEDSAARHWLIFADKDNIAEQLAAKLSPGKFTMVYSGDEFEQVSGDEIQVNNRKPEDFNRLVSELNEKGTDYNIVYLWGSEGGNAGPAPELSCHGLLLLLQAVKKINANPQKFMVVTKGSQPVDDNLNGLFMNQSPLWGIAHTITLEHPELNCTLLDLDPWPEEDQSVIIIDEMGSGSREARVAFRQSKRYVARINKLSNLVESAETNLVIPESKSYFLDSTSYGLLDKLSLQTTTRKKPAAGEVEIHVINAGLNFKDVLKALGRYSGSDKLLGDECAGVISAVGEGIADFKVGDEVVAIVQGSFRSFITVPAVVVAHKPENMNFETAAALPVTFLTAYYALHYLAKITAGKKVLIHAGAGGVGLAAIEIARQSGAEIFSTAGSPEKRALLRSNGIKYVFNSRTLDFADEILTITAGEGVDIVLNSLAGEFISKSMAVLREDGCFVEIGKTDIWTEEKVRKIKPQAKYFPFFLGDIVDNQPQIIQDMYNKIFTHFKNNDYKPLPLRVYPVRQSIQAFKYMAQAKHIGKIILNFEESGTPDENKIRPDVTYLITGGLKGIGFEVAQWIVNKGGRYLVLLARSQPSEEVKNDIKLLEEKGAKVQVAPCDVSSKEQLSEILVQLKKEMPPLRGVVHSAGVLDDGVLVKQSWERFERVFAAKIDGAWNLHELTVQMPLDFFVLFSSISSAFGSAGQGNYVAANTFLDALAYYRQSKGLPAMTINWGAWEEVGMLAALDEKERMQWARKGINSFSPEQGIQVLDQLLDYKAARVIVSPVNWSQYKRALNTEGEKLFFSKVGSADESGTEEEALDSSEFKKLFFESSESKKQSLVVDLIREEAKTILGFDSVSSVKAHDVLQDLGFDSLMAVQLRNSLSSNLDINLPTTLIFDYPTVETMATFIVTQLVPDDMQEIPIEKVNKEPEFEAMEDDAELSMSDIEEMSDDEAQELLRQELQKKF